MAPGYPAYAAATISASFAAGWAVDRFGPPRLLPLALLPMAVGISLVGPAETPVGWMASLALMGLTQGMVGTMWGTLLPHLYGTHHLGSVRALATAIMVLSTAIGPGITGMFIDWGVPFPDQALTMGLWCLCLSLAMIPVARRIAG